MARILMVLVLPFVLSGAEMDPMSDDKPFNVDYYIGVITKDTGKDDFDNIKDGLAELGVKVSFDGLVYNTFEEIIQITISLRKGTQRLSERWKDRAPIPDIHVGVIGGQLILNMLNPPRGDSKGQPGTIFQSIEGNDYNKDELFEYYDSDDEVVNRDEVPGETKGFTFHNLADSNSMFIVNGEIVKANTLQNLSPKEIEQVSVVLGNAAEEKYGDKGKNGVIEITLKKNP